MSFSFSYSHSATFSIDKSADWVYSFLTDYEKAIGDLFPGLQRFSKQSPPDLYRWEFSPLVYGGKSFIIQFDTTFEQKPREIIVHPSKNRSHPQLEGIFKVIETEQTCDLFLSFELELIVPFPSLAKGIISPLATKELNNLFFEYDRNLQKALQ